MKNPKLKFCIHALLLVVVSAGIAHADWTATGTFKYQDREFNVTGFTGVTPAVPIRLAKVEVLWQKTNGSWAVLASGATDAAGNFSIFIPDTTIRNIQVRAVTTSTGVSGLYLQVTNGISPYSNYAVTTATFPNHAPTVNLNIGTLTASIGAGGEPFNIYDVGLNSIEYLAFLNGSRPGSSQQLTLRWQSGIGVTTNSYLFGSDTILVADNSAYNDTVMQHESGHYAVDNFSASDSPGGFHRLSVCTQDLRLAFDEGFATFFGQSVRRHFGLPNPHLYVKMTGASGAGNLDFWFDVENEVPYACNTATSEVTVYAVLWDIFDSALVPDNTPTSDDLHDSLAAAPGVGWDVMRNYIPSAANKSVEDFWDGWFVRGGGSLTEMRTLFEHQGMEYFEDITEPNDSVTAAVWLPVTGLPTHATYFNALASGAGSADSDYFKFDGAAGTTYVIETTLLNSDANTSIQLIAPDRVTVLASNDDRAPGIKSSLITYAVATNGSYYIKSFHGPGWGIYGSYDLSVKGGYIYGGTRKIYDRNLPLRVQSRQSIDGDPPESGGKIGISFEE